MDVELTLSIYTAKRASGIDSGIRGLGFTCAMAYRKKRVAATLNAQGRTGPTVSHPGGIRKFRQGKKNGVKALQPASTTRARETCFGQTQPRPEPRGVWRRVLPLRNTIYSLARWSRHGPGGRGTGNRKLMPTKRPNFCRAGFVKCAIHTNTPARGPYRPRLPRPAVVDRDGGIPGTATTTSKVVRRHGRESVLWCLLAREFAIGALFGTGDGGFVQD